MIQKNIIIGIIAAAMIAGGAYLFFNDLRGGDIAPGASGSPQVTPFRQSGEVSFANLAKLSGCELPPDTNASAGKYDAFAKCLTEKGVKMYGAWWCGHCANQKKAFGDSFQYVNYIECSTEGKQDQLPVCSQEGITGYPTWEFPKTTGTSVPTGTIQPSSALEAK